MLQRVIDKASTNTVGMLSILSLPMNDEKELYGC
jgi:hypothetical protein